MDSKLTNHAADQEFTLDHGFETPEPFDRAIANLDMRCTANSVGNGMSLMVTASFGSDYVNIDLSDGGKLEVKCEIHRAMIVAKPYKCDFTDLELEDVRGGFRYKQEFSAKRSHSQVAQTSIEGGEHQHKLMWRKVGRLPQRALGKGLLPQIQRISTAQKAVESLIRFNLAQTRLQFTAILMARLLKGAW